ncbi:uncharacterized protein PGTG_13173 [Puccinia graminis f. sp. tritici CRL 75-36-700-3]|uniref:Uncharacterized protein n=1 Tax=Puccinia graminis f. sp. tritici (strain CRL 75-36-700-3 / race SCCL) TaxID=418459 RepID=E3KR66_PUCGT|nr:uncharacterized protein PGTG_13173 [Puccinia graminis f. sp. tritici CRL 75-36-700-3]EFP86791.2 hypothetical protein PGTG_13173 [Puccinia graminis f. sp. tritici CRL 75-36-700-3]
MTAPFRYRRIKLILAVCCFQAIQCMHGDLPSSVLSQTYHKPPDVATSSTSRYMLNSQVVAGGHHQMASEPEMKNPPTSEDGIKRYFNSVRQLRRPTTGLAREKFDRGTSQEEKQIEFNFLLEDVLLMTEELEKLMKEVRKNLGKKSRRLLPFHALRYVHHLMMPSIKNFLARLAREHGLPEPGSLNKKPFSKEMYV